MNLLKIDFSVFFTQLLAQAERDWLNNNGIFWIIGGIIAFFIAIIFIGVVVFYGKLWFQAYMSNAHISVFSLIWMSLRQVDARTIVNAKIIALHSGISSLNTQITTRRLEAHYLAGGNVPYVIRALVAAHRAGIDLDIDRAGRTRCARCRSNERQPQGH
jgi:uncharacterized protein YqfA (UPF0365 family)